MSELVLILGALLIRLAANGTLLAMMTALGQAVPSGTAGGGAS